MRQFFTLILLSCFLQAAHSRDPRRGFTAPPSWVLNAQPVRSRLKTQGNPPGEDVAALPQNGRTGTEALAGCDEQTNGFSQQGPDVATLTADNVVPGRSFNDNRYLFEEIETVKDGLGPTYNAQSCRECHQNVVTGGANQVAEARSGRMDNGQFFESLGGSLIQSRATYADIVEHIGEEDATRTCAFR